MPNICVDQADTYKCYARNEYGKAVVTVTLNVIEGGLLCYLQYKSNQCNRKSIKFILYLLYLVGYKKNKAMQQSRTGTRLTFISCIINLVV